ncbi:MAG: YcxB family protein [Lachnospiraceae bacterium]|nr:YcxB family protein [Lachnospiraceae bacterium]MBR4573905.1 YcxB family protein [Lachnospiraceae bacterium]
MDKRFSYTYTTGTFELWQASMYYAYSSFMGVVNVVFIVSALALIFARWGSASDLFKALMVVMLLLFTVIQPVSIWLRCRASLGGRDQMISLTVSDSGIDVSSDGKSGHITWDGVKGVVKKPTLVIIYSGDGAGYILGNAVLKETKNELYDFVQERIKEDHHARTE